MAIFSDSRGPGGVGHIRESEIVAPRLRVQIQAPEIRSPEDLDNAFQAAVKGRAEALVVVSTGLMNAHRDRVVNFARKTRLPAMYSASSFTLAGGLMSYDTDVHDRLRGVATYVDKILRGTQPGDLAVQRPTKFDFVVKSENRQTHRPQHTAARAGAGGSGNKVSLYLAVIFGLLTFGAAEAQAPKNIPLVAFLVPGSASSYSARIEAFRQTLRELGYIEGKNINIEYRYTEGKRDQLPALASELVQLKADVIVTGTTPAIQAVKNTTSTIPIVMAEVADPVAVGFVANFARPGGNITGFTTLSPDLDGNRLELLKQILPNVTRVAFIWDSANSANRIRFKQVQSAAQALAITLQSLEVRNPTELGNAIEAAIRDRPDALMVPNPTVLTYGRQIADFGAKNRLPLVYDTREHAEKAAGPHGVWTELCRAAPSHGYVCRQDSQGRKTSRNANRAAD
jgi:putative ABC transport system substrate-binding protein